MSEKQILDVNNAVREFIQYYSHRNKTRINEQIPMNYYRYYLLRFWNEPCYVFFKFSRNPYFMAREGMSETINQVHVKKLVQLYNQGELKVLYFALQNGYIYFIRLKDFLEKSHIEVEERVEGKSKYVIPIKCLTRYNDEMC